jgi:hypothetical protein
MGETVKLVFCVRRRSDVGPEEFQRYWLEEHAVLVRSVGELLRIRRYVQSHTVHGPLTDALTASRGAAEPYDGIAELWFDVDDLQRELTEQALAANVLLLEDERRFIDLERSSLFFSVEHEIITA